MTIDSLYYNQLQKLQKEEKKVNIRTGILSIRTLTPIFLKVSVILKRRKLNTTFFQSMNKNLIIIERDTQSMVENLTLTTNVSEALYEKLLTILNSFQSKFNKLEKANFIKNKKTEYLINKIIDDLYIIEADFRQKAYSDKPKLDDTELIEFISGISNKNIEAYGR